MRRDEENQVRQVVAGVSLLLTIAVMVVGSLIGWRMLPGLLREWAGTGLGLMSTPFILEASFAVLGLVIVVLINHFRRKREGDEFVYLEQVAGPEVPGDLPERSRWAVYSSPPLDGAEVGLLERAEGEWAAGDMEAALRWISEMPEEELSAPGALALRIGIARASGKHELAEKLERQLGGAETGGGA